MSSAILKPRITPEEYLAIEETAPYKSEYYEGEMYAMAGASPTHSLINMNVGAALRARLRGTRCKPFDSGLHVHVPATQLYVYPDVTVVCGPLEYVSGSTMIVINPSLIVEVLSPATEGYDRSAKFFHYQSIHALRDYILISQAMPRVEHFYRQPEAEQPNQWVYTAYQGISAVLRLPSLKIELPLNEVYEDVEFAGPGDEFPAGDFAHPGPPPV